MRVFSQLRPRSDSKGITIKEDQSYLFSYDTTVGRNTWKLYPNRAETQSGYLLRNLDDVNAIQANLYPESSLTGTSRRRWARSNASPSVRDVLSTGDHVLLYTTKFTGAGLQERIIACPRQQLSTIIDQMPGNQTLDGLATQQIFLTMRNGAPDSTGVSMDYLQSKTLETPWLTRPGHANAVPLQDAPGNTGYQISNRAHRSATLVDLQRVTSDAPYAQHLPLDPEGKLRDQGTIVHMAIDANGVASDIIYYPRRSILDNLKEHGLQPKTQVRLNENGTKNAPSSATALAPSRATKKLNLSFKNFKLISFSPKRSRATEQPPLASMPPDTPPHVPAKLPSSYPKRKLSEMEANAYLDALHNTKPSISSGITSELDLTIEASNDFVYPILVTRDGGRSWQNLSKDAHLATSGFLLTTSADIDHLKNDLPALFNNPRTTEEVTALKAHLNSGKHVLLYTPASDNLHNKESGRLISLDRHAFSQQFPKATSLESMAGQKLNISISEGCVQEITLPQGAKEPTPAEELGARLQEIYGKLHGRKASYILDFQKGPNSSIVLFSDTKNPFHITDLAQWGTTLDQLDHTTSKLVLTVTEQGLDPHIKTLPGTTRASSSRGAR